MPTLTFFKQLGLFILPDFLDPESRVSLWRQMAAAPAEEAVVVGPRGEQQLDLATRKVDCCLPSKEVRVRLEQRLQEIKPEIERHFGLRLSNCETPQYLIYAPGDFFKPHLDAGDYGGQNFTSSRRVSVVIFLNRQSQEPAEDAYGEGQFTLYGLLDGPQWEKCACPLDAEPGLLIAFPSDKWHEVKPVSHGRRFTVVTWFHDPETQAVDVKPAKPAWPIAI